MRKVASSTGLLLMLGACADDEPAAPVIQTAELTGLYQGPAAGAERSRLCMLAETAGQASFALVVAGPGGVCSGAGRAKRRGDRILLAMTGDEPCEIETRLSGTDLTFPDTVPQGCDYYCGPGGSLRGAALSKTGGTRSDALQARDLAGDALCD